MAITTYAELLTAVQSWLHRSDLASQAADFITLGEAHLNRSLRCPDMETTATVTTSTSDRFAALPTRFLESASLDYQGIALTHASQSDVARLAAVNSSSLPSIYAVTSRFEFDRVSDAAYSLTLSYVKSLDIETDSTNWLLTRHPDAYLYSALAEAAPYLRDDARIGIWTAKRDSSVMSAAGAEKWRRPDTLRTGLVTTEQYNILTG